MDGSLCRNLKVTIQILVRVVFAQQVFQPKSNTHVEALLTYHHHHHQHHCARSNVCRNSILALSLRTYESNNIHFTESVPKWCTPTHCPFFVKKNLNKLTKYERIVPHRWRRTIDVLWRQQQTVGCGTTRSAPTSQARRKSMSKAEKEPHLTLLWSSQTSKKAQNTRADDNAKLGRPQPLR